jgi:acyl-homoserine-lactone acylase
MGVPLDGRLGDYQHETRNGVRVPLHGGVGELDGSYNSLHFRTGLEAGGYFNVAWGTSYVQTVTFDADGPVAHGMLVYGQSVDPRSAHYADQLPLFSRKEWPRLPFSESQVRADPNYTVTSLRE